MKPDKFQILEKLGESKAKRLRRLCQILDHKREIYDINELVKLTRDQINDLITEKIDEPWQRFDS